MWLHASARDYMWLHASARDYMWLHAISVYTIRLFIIIRVYTQIGVNFALSYRTVGDCHGKKENNNCDFSVMVRSKSWLEHYDPST